MCSTFRTPVASYTYFFVLTRPSRSRALHSCLPSPKLRSPYVKGPSLFHSYKTRFHSQDGEIMGPAHLLVLVRQAGIPRTTLSPTEQLLSVSFPTPGRAGAAFLLPDWGEGGRATRSSRASAPPAPAPSDSRPPSRGRWHRSGTATARGAAGGGSPRSTWRSRGAVIWAEDRRREALPWEDRGARPSGATPALARELPARPRQVGGLGPAPPAPSPAPSPLSWRRLGPPTCPPQRPPGPLSVAAAGAQAYLAGEVQLRLAVERLAVLAAVRVEAAVEPGGSRRGPGRPRGAGLGGEHRGRDRRVHRGATPLRRHL